MALRTADIGRWCVYLFGPHVKEDRGWNVRVARCRGRLYGVYLYLGAYTLQVVRY